MGPRLRSAVLRGDLESIAAALVVLAVVGVALWWNGAVPAGLWVAGPALALAAAIFPTSYQLRQRLGRELAARYDGMKPTECPVPFISDALWKEANTFQPALHLANEMMSEVDPAYKPFDKDIAQAILDPQIRIVSKDEAPPEAAVLPVPPDALAQLTGVEGHVIAVSPLWPVCCGALCQLQSNSGGEGTALLPPPLDPPLDPEKAPPTTREEPGWFGFQCLVCGTCWSTDRHH